MNHLERLRGQVVRHELNKLGQSWERRRLKLVSTFLDPQRPTAQEILSLGDSLSEAFRLNFVNDRSQTSLSGGGSAWQALICHYLNLCLAGTDGVALTRKFVPACIKDALKMGYTGSASVNADLDVMVVFAPGASNLAGSNRNFVSAFGSYIADNFEATTVVVVQAKTNWNDNAQIPMLWNFIYKLAALGKIPSNGFSVGSGSWHLQALRSFAYAFVTVPTNKLELFRPNSMAVLRVATMSGGAYWGRPTRNGVILSLKEFFSRNYNVANNNFPAPAQMGIAFAKECQDKLGNIDVESFALTLPAIT